VKTWSGAGWITTERLSLRPLRAEDAEIIAAYRNDPQVAQYQGWPLPYTPEDSAQLIAEMVGRSPGEPGWVQIGLQRVSSGELIGDLALNTQGQQAEVGVTLSAAVQGQGYASEGLGGLIQYAFRVLGLDRLQAEIDPRNLAVAKLLSRLGFVHLETQIGTYLHRGEWADNAVYTLGRASWTS
jgi:RimJ/RimL family protein N-acetyltransferase